jgi:cytochrome c5
MLISQRLMALTTAAFLTSAALSLAASGRGPSAAPSLAARAAAQASAQPSAETLEKGKELTERVCMACHELGPDVTAGRSAEAWKKTLEEMRVMGAQGSDEEFELILAYLVHTYPAKPGR